MRGRAARPGQGRPLQAQLPTMRSFTFLRLTPEMLVPPYEATWARFVQRMHANSAARRPPADPAAGLGLGLGSGTGLMAGRARSGPVGVEPQAVRTKALRTYSGSGVFVPNAAGEMVPVEALAGQIEALSPLPAEPRPPLPDAPRQN